MLHLILWWLFIQVLALIFLPLSFALFKNLPDRGYPLSKPLALLLLSYLLWMGGSIHIIPFSTPYIILFPLLFGLLSLIGYRQTLALRSLNLRAVVSVEIVFILSFLLWSLVRAYNPGIIPWGEKFMDFAFLNSILRSHYFPPPDPWLSGFCLGYYYFGYLIMAVPIKLLHTPPEIGYNLSLSLLFALTAISAFSLVYNLVKIVKPQAQALPWALTGVGFLLFLGNLEGALEFLYAHNIGSADLWKFIGIKGLTQPYSSPGWLPTESIWWWRATRVIDTLKDGISLDYTINEFPFFSFIFGDLHPHLMALPFSLLALGISLNIFLCPQPLGLPWLWQNWWRLALSLICVGALGFINTWDLPTFLTIFLIAIFLHTVLTQGKMRRAIALSLFATAGIFLLYLPYYLSPKPLVYGILPWLGPSTRHLHYFIIWGVFLFLCLSLLVRHSLRQIGIKEYLGCLLLCLAPLGLWSLIPITLSQWGLIGDKLWRLSPLLLILALNLCLIIKEAEKGGNKCLFPFVLIFSGLFITLSVELFYVADAFGNRMNTVFKFYLQAWLLLSLSSAFSLFYLCQGKVYKIWWAFLSFLLLCASIYPIATTITISRDFKARPTLDGLYHLDPMERQAIMWLREKRGSPVIVEAVGRDYTLYSRISSFTGLPTILGQGGHEAAWRGSLPLQGRVRDVDRIYTSPNMGEVKRILKKYKVRYIYIGELERAKYGHKVEKRLGFLEMVFRNERVIIYHFKG